ncbi:Ribokinase [Paenibacillus plantiphilus]|uniref:Ribokinase n=1 Tax=Paenibacillus plantiphilus TaxID=2905650 RepID=A0ABM9CR97_9BACL|nr:ribokinase [Paenibacillus plantiphilus]CAH1221202.1 Ribokinase [Paenibacillus plantiphilus]
MMGTEIPNIVVIGSINMDIVVETPLVPDKGQTLLGNAMTLLPGGKGANQAVAASRLATHTTLIGAVGQDSFGEQIMQNLDGHSITRAIASLADESTGIASIWVHDRDNRIIVVPGANGKISWEDIESQKSFIDHANVVLLQLEIPLETVVKSIAYAHRCGKKVILNPAPALPLPDEVYPMLFSLTPNLHELSVMADMPEVLDEGNPDALQRAMRKLIDKGLASLTVTLGAEGAIYMDASGNTFHVPGKKMTVLDTTGAGDCFNAAFAVAVAKGQPMKRAVEYAVAASALAVTKFGAQNGMPESDEVEWFLQSTSA